MKLGNIEEFCERTRTLIDETAGEGEADEFRNRLVHRKTWETSLPDTPYRLRKQYQSTAGVGVGYSSADIYSVEITDPQHPELEEGDTVLQFYYPDHSVAAIDQTPRLSRFNQRGLDEIEELVGDEEAVEQTIALFWHRERKQTTEPTA